jgi:hypothetical protein
MVTVTRNEGFESRRNLNYTRYTKKIHLCRQVGLVNSTIQTIFGLVFTADRLQGLRVRIPPGAWMVVRCVCCQVEVSATGWSLVQRSPTDLVRPCVWSRNLKNEAAQTLKGCKCRIERKNYCWKNGTKIISALDYNRQRIKGFRKLKRVTSTRHCWSGLSTRSDSARVSGPLLMITFIFSKL